MNNSRTRDLLLLVACIGPVWLLAGDWSDGDELTKTMFGPLALGLKWLWDNRDQIVTKELTLADHTKVHGDSYWRGFKDAGGES